MKLRFIDSGFSDGYTNMAIDEALLDSEDVVLRLYQWKPACVSLGYNQNASAEIDLDYCKKNNIAVVRRITGGKAVFHDNELTYSLIIPKGFDIVPENVTESYRVIANALISAFEKIGIDAELKMQPDRIATSICFNSSNWYELLASGKKISGSAQRRMDGVVLQHGSLLIDFDAERNSYIFQSEGKDETLEKLRENITSIVNETKNNTVEFSIDDLKKAMKESFSELFDFEIEESSLSEEELKKVEELKKEKYLTGSWNLRD